MRVYISGPLGNLTPFNTAELKLLKLGHEVVSPTYMPSMSNPKNRYIQRMNYLLTCDSIYFLPGWKNNKECLIHYHFANLIGLKIMFNEPEDNSGPLQQLEINF